MRHVIEIEIEDAEWCAAADIVDLPKDADALRESVAVRLATIGLAVLRWEAVGAGTTTAGDEGEGDGDDR